MSTAEHLARRSIQNAADNGDDAALAIAARLAGEYVTAEDVRAAGQRGLIPGDPLLIDPSDPLAIAQQILEADWSCGDFRVIHHCGGMFYEWRDGCYRPADVNSIRAGVWQRLATAQQLIQKNDADAELKVVKPTNHLVNSVMDALRAVANLHQRHVAPCWLEHDPDLPAAEHTLAMPDGLLYLPTRAQFPPDPRFWTHTALSFNWQRDAPDPVAWIKFLCEVWQDDPESIDTLQELFGLMLLPDTKHQKIFLIVGPKRSGKGTIARILTAMLGADNVCAPTLAGMSTPFGMAPLIGKLAAIISDARLSGRADQAQIAERLLSVSGEDAITIDRKHATAWTGRLSTRFVILSNELPRLADASGALASRFVVLNMTQSFYGREDLGLADRLLGELPGIFNWALAGYDRLRRRGHFKQPESARGAIDELNDLGSPVGAFVRERCIVGPGRSAVCAEVYIAWKDWCQIEGRDHPGTQQTLGRDLRAAVPGMRVSQPRSGTGRVRQYEGLGLI